MVSVVVLNVEARREKLPAREALGTWIPTDADMEILSLNGELERDRVAKWVAALKKDDARPLQDEDKLDIGDMETADKDLVIALLRQYAGIVEKKPGCPPLAKVNVEHHINTGNTAPIMQRRRRHAVSENLFIDKEVDDMLSNQDQGHGDQPVAYASNVNSPTVSNYSISELECLAVVSAVRLFRPHLYGRRFSIVTDHIALKWLMTAKEPAGRLHRWSLTLQVYDFDIQYRPGKENHVADALSRGPVPVTGERADDGDRPADDPVIGLQDVQSVTEEKVAVANMQYAAEPMHGSTPRKQSDEIDADVDGAARSVIQAASVRRVEAAELGAVQFTDDYIKREQGASVMVQSLLRKGAYRGQRVYRAEDGLVRVELEGGDRIILPVIYWALAFKEANDSICAGHLRGPPTFERLQRMYWWPRMREAVQSWVAACQDCGSRKAKPKAVVPPLRSVRTGDVCDRWAIDVAGPLPVTAGGNRYVIAAVEYTTRYAVATAVSEHTAKGIARFLMDKRVFVYGPMREIMMDDAMEFGSKATAELLELMQVKQSTPVPYRPKLLGLVKRFHRTWIDIVSLYVDEGQDDWDDVLPSALYAYNSSRHSTHGFQPNELMMGRKLRTPAELLRRSRVTHPVAGLHIRLTSP
ncbi:hypothetical protein PR003_g25435 [Phytophthora rubi]|uniref:Integrase catalytic domain-containing protein n=1 Tax=Phytophthora rubi TaxID=129364 RepID=A0A6A4CKF0_9STRA|nr:hypothetical protein PR003_g25435 [Phytophthora rubi]